MAKQQKAVSIKDIADSLGVSTSLVSFVLNGKAKQHRVNEELAKKVLQVAKEMNYRPNILAKSLRNGKTRSLGIVVTDFSNPFFAHMARYMEDFAETRGYAVHFTSSGENVQRMEKLLDSLCQRSIDGFIIVPCEGSQEIISGLKDRNFPILLLDRNIPGLNISSLSLDNRKAAREGTEHLISEGFEDIGFIAYDMKLQHMYDRIEGYTQAMTAAGLQDKICVSYANFQNISQSCEKAVDEMLAKGVKAMFFACNSIATECVSILMKKKIRIPEDISLVVFDGGDVFRFFRCPITYIEQPLQEMARKAVDNIIDQIENSPEGISEIVTEARLVIGESSLKKSLNKDQGWRRG